MHLFRLHYSRHRVMDIKPTPLFLAMPVCRIGRFSRYLSHHPWIICRGVSPVHLPLCTEYPVPDRVNMATILYCDRLRNACCGIRGAIFGALYQPGWSTCMRRRDVVRKSTLMDRRTRKCESGPVCEDVCGVIDLLMVVVAVRCASVEGFGC